MPSEILRSQLCSLSEGLKEVLSIVTQESISKENAQQREQLANQYLRQERKEHSQLLNRKSVIESRKEKIENIKNAQVNILSIILSLITVLSEFVANLNSTLYFSQF